MNRHETEMLMRSQRAGKRRDGFARSLAWAAQGKKCLHLSHNNIYSREDMKKFWDLRTELCALVGIPTSALRAVPTKDRIEVEGGGYVEFKHLESRVEGCIFNKVESADVPVPPKILAFVRDND